VSSTRPYASNAPVPYLIPPLALGLILISPLIVGLVAIIYRRLKEPTSFPTQAIVVALILLALMTAFVVLNEYSHTTTTPQSTNPSPAPSPTPGPGNNKTNNTNQSNTTNGTTGGTVLVNLRLPGWVMYVVAAAIGLGILGVVVPAASAWLDRRGIRETGTSEREAKRVAASAALSRALSELDQGNDPRHVIERLYGRFLNRVEPLAGDVAPRTPEEIRADVLIPLGVRPTAAAALTRLFEEARYSTHRMNVAQATEVREAIGVAAADLSRLPAAQ
jgi:hypothetical protein